MNIAFLIRFCIVDIRRNIFELAIYIAITWERKFIRQLINNPI